MMRTNIPTSPRGSALGCAALGVVALVSGCGRAPEPTPEKAGEARAPVAAPVERGTVIAEIGWPAASAIATEVIAALPAAAAKAIAASPVPVLVPRRGELLAAGVMVTDQHWYSWSARAGGVTVTVAGTRLAHRYSNIPPAKGTSTIRGASGFITQNEAIWSATWVEGGATYTIDVECAEPTEARCADDAFLRALAADLVFVGGAGVRR